MSVINVVVTDAKALEKSLAKVDIREKMPGKKYILSERQLEALQRLIVNKHYMPVEEEWGDYFYETVWHIEGRKYRLFKVIGSHEVEGIEFGVGL